MSGRYAAAIFVICLLLTGFIVGRMSPEAARAYRNAIGLCDAFVPRTEPARQEELR
jgi:hypothetical protein